MWSSCSTVSYVCLYGKCFSDAVQNVLPCQDRLLIPTPGRVFGTQRAEMNREKSRVAKERIRTKAIVAASYL